ncbi:MAG: glycosyltransferase [Nitrospirales bacterium]|nr:glycosyltransferase [Nitrospirales bacterium]
MTGAELFLVPVSLFLTGAALYLFFLAAVYFFGKPQGSPAGCAPERRFVLIVPAHNEAEGIGGTLRSLKELDYPPHLYAVVVVADNCTDSTAAVAGAEGIRCLERKDPSRRGKGHALAFALRILMRERYDCFVVVDADSTVHRNFLRVLNGRSLAGQRVIQACYGIANPDASPLTYLFAVGVCIENRLFYEAKTRLGLPVHLRGNGMCFARETLRKQPWSAFSVVEDVEYGIKLIRRGIPVHFALETEVRARQPETFGQARNQRVRWASGNAKISRSYAFTLLKEGVLKRSCALFDAGLSFFVLSKPLLLLLSLLLAAGALLYASTGAPRGRFYAGWSLALLGAQAVYLSLGIFLEGLDRRRLSYLLSAPFLLLWFFFIALLGLAGYRGNLWLRTKRT